MGIWEEFIEWTDWLWNYILVPSIWGGILTPTVLKIYHKIATKTKAIIKKLFS